MALEMDGIMLHACKCGSGANGQNQSQGKSLAATGTVKTEVPKSETSELAAAIRELAAAIRQSRNSGIASSSNTNGTKTA